MSATGAISGTIAASTPAGSFAVTATVTDSKGTKASRSFTLTVSATPLTLSGLSTGTAVVGAPFSASVTASGGVPPYTFSGSGPGVTVSPGGAVSGTFTAAGGAAVSVTVTDSAGASVSQTFQIAVGLPSSPTLTLGGLPNAADPGTQSTVQVSLGAPYPVDVVLTLTMTFTPDSGPDDPNVQFSTGGRSIRITIPAGSTAGGSPVGVQSGTVAGTITITTQATAAGQDITPDPGPKQTIRINASAPVIRSVTATRSSGILTVTVVGFATDREMTQAVFQFTGSAGANLQNGSVTVPVSSLFSTWYGNADSAQYGSQFTFTQTFNVQGDASTVASVSVTLTNQVGSSKAASANLP